uniref:GTP diphosphokinase n=1 Tax=Salix viminalis TaxID=40686 RepID=A0A6N2KKB3_SALVM
MPFISPSPSPSPSPSCETQISTMFITLKTSPFLFHRYSLHFRSSYSSKYKYRCLLDQIAPVSANVIAAAVASSGSSSLHGAVSSAITHVAVTAVAIASGACLSTRVDFLWPKGEEQPGCSIVDGVDVTGYPIFNEAKVVRAIAFAKKAHHGQFRKTGDPYFTHCIHTARILAMLVPSTGKRAIDTLVSGILHDVVEDTSETLLSIEENFGEDVAKLVAGVSKISYINQLLRRHRRLNVNQGTLGHDEANNLRVMLLGMVNDPRVVLIKLADRLHNMRTIYALQPSKARAVAEETLLIWCSLASRLGLWALKAELEDLCFAVLQPQLFQKMRSDLASMWSSSNKAEYPRRIIAWNEKNSTPGYGNSMTIDNDVSTMKDLLEAVVPFDILLDRRKRSKFLNNLGLTSNTQTRPKVVQDAGIALASLAVCEEMLERELFISTSYVPGMEVTLSSRLKSLYSIYSKMKRKDVSINKVYDARALRVVVGDKNGILHGPAIQCCYSLLDIVHRLWTPIVGELDDYIVNPKPSGYQSLHITVQGPDNASLEVQIRTQKMHEYAEHGLAAHWLYKETGNSLSSIDSNDESEIQALSYLSKDIDDQTSVEDDQFQKYRSLKAGHPVLRVEGSHLLAAVIIRYLMSGGVNQDMVIGVLASKNIHFVVMQDQFERLLPTFIQVIDLMEEEESEYRAVISAVFEGKPVDSIASRPSIDTVASTSMEASINNKVRLLRTMLQWEEQLRYEAFLGQPKHEQKSYISLETVGLGEVVIVCWPHGEIIRLRSGSTAADAARRVGFDGKLVLVNGQLVLPNTELKDGDVVEIGEVDVIAILMKNVIVIEGNGA